ncbi:MAG TPA: 50S ribosomal protein L32 [Elusimicrobia bacterium]|nr:MAG: 50S ribosomal protein L32 [Elusimicrobia bacterium GWA2_64_40]OGR65293.1 MAG: 50S ribosomal protein L32 [Elusimicrobia bacterium GWB2_63_16]HAN04305.1 50S ribosomal protein L32 [Elusimicrobiota bacterium]HAU90399.1 50S ribosomal protein L32 [Elusimicrobiota bacterium]
MPNPKRKHTPMRRDKRRSQNWKLEVKSLSPCGNCGALRLPHRVCPSCGSYNGKIEVAQKVAKNEEGNEQK